MKKLFLSILVLSIFVAGCKKDEEKVVQTSGEGEIVFAGHQIDQTQLKNHHIDDIAEYALIGIRDGDGVLTEYMRLVHYIDGIPYTQTIKLPDGIYTVETFVLMDDAQTPDFYGDDVEIWATPMEGSEFAPYVDKPTFFEIDVLPFGKLQIEVEVLRFIPDEYESFGFDWFIIEQSVLREHCFFGNLCIKSLGDYAGSLYENQANGVQMDMTALAYVEVWQNNPDAGWVLTGTFSNVDPQTGWYGEGAPICAMYEDHLMYDDMYRFDLYVYVANGEGFDYKLFQSWTVDESDLQTYPWPMTGEDNVTDYVIGTCSPDADLILPPYMDLPETVTYEIIASPGPDSYILAELSGIPAGYDIWDGEWQSWCFDHQVVIQTNHPYSMDVYSSLYPWLMPEYVSQEQWDNANWLMNHLSWYDGYTWQDIQGALWLMDLPTPWDGSANYPMPALSTLDFAEDMYDDAMLYGEGYLPPPGGWAAVIFVPEGTPPGQQEPDIQTVFIVVDP